jgi:hypothetical protein
MLVREARRNSLSEFSDRLVNSSILRRTKEDDSQKAMNNVIETIVSIAGGFGARIAQRNLTPVEPIVMLWSSQTKTSNGERHD